MELPVVIEPLPDGKGYTARLAAPLDLSPQAATAEEAHQQLALLLQRRLQEGVELRTLTVPLGSAPGSQAGWLPDDELTQEWIKEMQAYRAECDAADRQRLAATPPETMP